jgi:hypothetical protein
MSFSGRIRRVALVRTDILEEISVSFRVTGIGELGATIAVTCKLRLPFFIAPASYDFSAVHISQHLLEFLHERFSLAESSEIFLGDLGLSRQPNRISSTAGVT